MHWICPFAYGLPSQSFMLCLHLKASAAVLELQVQFEQCTPDIGSGPFKLS